MKVRIVSISIAALVGLFALSPRPAESAGRSSPPPSPALVPSRLDSALDLRVPIAKADVVTEFQKPTIVHPNAKSKRPVTFMKGKKHWTLVVTAFERTAQNLTGVNFEITDAQNKPVTPTAQSFLGLSQTPRRRGNVAVPKVFRWITLLETDINIADGTHTIKAIPLDRGRPVAADRQSEPVLVPKPVAIEIKPAAPKRVPPANPKQESPAAPVKPNPPMKAANASMVFAGSFEYPSGAQTDPAEAYVLESWDLDWFFVCGSSGDDISHPTEDPSIGSAPGEEYWNGVDIWWAEFYDLQSWLVSGLTYQVEVPNVNGMIFVKRP